jgi:hypothetical protein
MSVCKVVINTLELPCKEHRCLSECAPGTLRGTGRSACLHAWRSRNSVRPPEPESATCRTSGDGGGVQKWRVQGSEVGGMRPPIQAARTHPRVKHAPCESRRQTPHHSASPSAAVSRGVGVRPGTYTCCSCLSTSYSACTQSAVSATDSVSTCHSRRWACRHSYSAR